MTSPPFASPEKELVDAAEEPLDWEAGGQGYDVIIVRYSVVDSIVDQYISILVY